MSLYVDGNEVGNGTPATGPIAYSLPDGAISTSVTTTHALARTSTSAALSMSRPCGTKP